MPPGRVVTHNNMLDSEVDDKEQNAKEGDANKTPQSAALQSITKDQHEEDHPRKKIKTNGFEKSLGQGPVLDEKLKEEIKDISDANKDHAANHAKPETKSEDNIAACHEKAVGTLENEEQKPKTEPAQS